MHDKTLLFSIATSALAYPTISAFFLHYFDELESIILQEHASLLELNVRLIEFLLDSFQIDCPIEITPDYRDPTALGGDVKDLRNTILLKQPLPDPHFEEKSGNFFSDQNFAPLGNFGP